MADSGQYSIGWICAIGTESIAAELMFDEQLSVPDGIKTNDTNSYKFGRISAHNVVVACLPQCQYGISNATATVKDMLHSFPIKTVFMVGIAGGAPNLDNDVDIRLGDVVVSTPGINNGGVLQYGFGKKHQDKQDVLRFKTTGHLNQPPLSVLNAVSQMESRHRLEGHQIQNTMMDALCRRPKLPSKLRQELQRPNDTTDRLYQPYIIHAEGRKTCDSCGNDDSTLVTRIERDPEDHDPVIHYGLIASADSLMKDAAMRDRLSREDNVLCFEMESAGLMNHVPCIAIRGICDYADSHKNNIWQGYAAMTAAAYTKELLASIRPNQITAEARLSDKLDYLCDQVYDVHAQQSTIKNSIQQNAIVTWLSSPDPYINHNRARKQHQAGTGQWFLQSEKYLAWRKERNSFLWVNGIPGSGKTILTSSVIADLEQIADPNHNVLYFYFDFNDTEKQSPEKALRSLLGQIYRKRKDTWREFDALYSVCQENGSLSDDGALYELFENILQKSGEFWIVIDALDECHTRNDDPVHKLLPWIQRLREAKLNTHIMVTSRPEQDIKSSIEQWARVGDTICLQRSMANDDINAYITTKTKEMCRWQEHLHVQEHVETILAKKADGMFRWVACQFDVLNGCLDWPSVQRQLKNLPKTLNATYERILQNIEEQHRHYAIRLLQFLTYTKRPLTLVEAVDILAVDTSKKPRFDPENRLPIFEDVLLCCSSLVTLESREKDGSRIEEIQLAHFSVQEYFLSSPPEVFLAKNLEKSNASTAILDTCLSYLLDISHPRDRVQAKEDFPLAEYAAHYWLDHATIAEQTTKEASSLVVEYLSSDRFHSTQILHSGLAQEGIMDFRTSWADHSCETYRVDGLYFAAYGGLVHAVEALLKGGADANAQWGQWDSALCAASYANHADIVRALLSHGASIDAQYDRFGNALFAALCLGTTEIVEILLDHGTDINAAPFGRTALSEAADNGNMEIIHLLLVYGADVNRHDDDGRTSLHNAIIRGNAEIAELLLYYGADAKAECFEGINALGYALQLGNTRIAQLLYSAV